MLGTTESLLLCYWHSCPCRSVNAPIEFVPCIDDTLSQLTDIPYACKASQWSYWPSFIWSCWLPCLSCEQRASCHI